MNALELKLLVAALVHSHQLEAPQAAYATKLRLRTPTCNADAELSSPDNSPRYAVPSREDDAGSSPLYRGLRMHSNAGLYEAMRSASPSLAHSPSMMRHVRVEAEEVPSPAGQQVRSRGR
jgi:hypothetical protein